MQRELLEKQLREQKIELVRAIYVGPDGITRGKAFRPADLDAILESGDWPDSGPDVGDGFRSSPATQ